MVRIPPQNGQEFRSNLGNDSAAKWARIPPEFGQSFRLNWAPIPLEISH